MNFGKEKKTQAKRVYVCHTFYHAYDATVKELLKGREHFGEADLVLSTMSNDFGTLDERMRASGVFRAVYFFDEQKATSSEEVMSYHRDQGSIVKNMLQRITYTKLLGKLQEPYVPVDFAAYGDVYVYCDADPIGYYLQYKKIRYHALEDGLNCGILDNQARLSNRGAFPVKVFFAKLGLIFIQDGWSKYCIDYEVNDLSRNYKPPRNTIGVKRADMYARLTEEDHRTLTRIFLEDADAVTEAIRKAREKRPCVMILTEPLCAEEVRARMFGDLIKEYGEKHEVIIKPHPRDLLDYAALFPETVVISGRFPMEVLNDIPGLSVEELVSVITQADNIRFAKKIIVLGLDFLDRYEDPAIHRKMENLIRKEQGKA